MFYPLQKKYPRAILPSAIRHPKAFFGNWKVMVSKTRLIVLGYESPEVAVVGADAINLGEI
jgi:hypothetical protein